MSTSKRRRIAALFSVTAMTSVMFTGALPVLAQAEAASLIVSISSGDGYGTAQTVGYSRWTGRMHGDLTSRKGAKVYVSGKIVFDGNTDDVCGRMTGNVTSPAGQVVDGSCTGSGQLIGTPSGLEYRVCKDQTGPDPCGAWSAKSS